MKLVYQFGSQTQTPKCSKVLISGVSFCQRSLLQSQESDVLSYSERKIAKNFQGFAPGSHWEGSTASSQTPRLHNGFSPCYACRKTGTPKKLLDTALVAKAYFARGHHHSHQRNKFQLGCNSVLARIFYSRSR